MVQGIKAIFNEVRVIHNHEKGLTLTQIAKIEKVHRSCISKYLKAKGYKILSSRFTGPSIYYNKEKRIAKARMQIIKAKKFLALHGLNE